MHRQLRRLEDAGLLDATRVGNQKYYQARRDSPIFEELRGLAVKTMAVRDPLRRALAPLADGILAAFVFGSVASGSDRADSDIDLLVVTDQFAYPDLYEALQGAEEQLARPVNPTVMTSSDWHGKRAQPDSFIARIASLPKLFVVGSDSDLH